MTLFRWVLLMSACAFAGAVLLPHGLQRLDREYPFQGIEIMPGDQEHYYAVRVREVIDGFPEVANAYFASPKDQPPLQPALPEFLIARVIQLLGLDVVPGFVFMKGLSSMLLFAAFTAFFCTLSGRPWESLLAVAGLLFAGSALHAPWDIIPFLTDTNFSIDFLRFARPVNPQWSALLFLLALTSLASWMKERRAWKTILAGGLTAALLYSYVYAWTYLGVTVALLFLWYVLRRDWMRVRDLLFFGCAFLLLGIPYLLNFRELLQHPWYAATAARQGLAEKRGLVFGVWSLLFPLLAFLSRRWWPQCFPLLIALAASGLLALNQQVITGLYLVPHHYHWYFVQPLAGITALLLFYEWGGRLLPSGKRRIGFSIVLLLTISFGLLQQWKAYPTVRAAWGERQHLAPLFAFLQGQTQPGVSVFATEAAGGVRDFTPIYTAADVTFAGHAPLFLTSFERTRDAFFLDLWLQGLAPEDAEERFLTDLRLDVSSRLHAIYYREALGGFERIPDDLLMEHAAAYRAYVPLSLEEKLQRSPMDFAVFSSDDPETEALKLLREAGSTVYTDQKYSVSRYSVLPQKN